MKRLDDTERFCNAMLALRCGFPYAPALAVELLEAYWDVLKDQSIEGVEAATSAWLRRDTPFFPSAGELLALCKNRSAINS
jgi:hypothetical protein